MRCETLGLVIALATGALSSSSCGPGEPTLECVEIDQSVDTYGWCELAASPAMAGLTHEGELASAHSLRICVAPQANGSCQLCSFEEVEEALDSEVRSIVDFHVPECELEHWELGCMEDLESSMSGNPDDYCCYWVVIWGENCEEP